MAQACGFPECTLPRSHAGDFHVGDPTDHGRPLWPVAARRSEAEARVGTTTWPVYATLAPSTTLD